MSVFENMLSPQTGNEDEDRVGRLVDRGLSTYYRARLAHDLVGRVVDKFDPKAKLDETEKRLSIRLKKKQLGLPMDDDDYEIATNEGLSFTQKGAVAAFGKRAAESIPAPDFLKPHNARGLMGAELPKTTSLAGDAGHYLLSAGMRASGGKYGRVGSVIRRFFG